MKRELKIAAAVALGCMGLFAANVWADSARTKTGSTLTYLLNGSPVYKGSVSSYDAGFADNSSTNGGAGFTSFALDNTAFVMAQCNDAAFLMARRVGNTDAGTTGPRSVRVAQHEAFLVGMLQPGDPYVSVAPADAGSVQCKFFELK